MIETIDKMKYKVQAVIRRCHHWMSQPTLFVDVVSTILLVSLVWSCWGLGDVAGKTGLTAEQLADYVEEIPDQWNAQIEKAEQEGKITDYQYRVQKERGNLLISKSSELADRIRRVGHTKFMEELTSYTGGQALQLVTGSVGGTLAGHFTTKAAAEAASAAAGAAVDLTFTIAGVGSHFLQKDPSHFSSEVQAIIALIKEAQGGDPDQLMVAHFHNLISFYQNNADRFSDEEFIKSLTNDANFWNNLTNAGGSEDSPWADLNELVRWLANAIERPLPDGGDEQAAEEKEEESKPEIDLLKVNECMLSLRCRLCGTDKETGELRCLDENNTLLVKGNLSKFGSGYRFIGSKTEAEGRVKIKCNVKLDATCSKVIDFRFEIIGSDEDEKTELVITGKNLNRWQEGDRLLQSDGLSGYSYGTKGTDTCSHITAIETNQGKITRNCNANSIIILVLGDDLSGQIMGQMEGQ